MLQVDAARIREVAERVEHGQQARDVGRIGEFRAGDLRIDGRHAPGDLVEIRAVVRIAAQPQTTATHTSASST